jgi:hypothetical protein
MFGLFKKKSPSVKIVDRVFMSEEAKWNACCNLHLKEPSTVFVAWFARTKQSFSDYCEANAVHGYIVSSIEGVHTYSNRPLVLLEHHPSFKTESEQFIKLNIPELVVYSSLDEPLLGIFGGERIISLMQQLGMSANEQIQHSMVSRSIKNAQEKIDKKNILPLSAISQHDWLTQAGLITAL